MDWIKGLQKSINYIEANILENIEYEDIAKCAYSSSFHFQRIFSLLTKMTVGEYIRNRRLTLAGTELLMSKSKIIDIALKYGYTTPESFTKSFTRFHGITPSMARKTRANLKSFSPLSIKIIIEGGDIMDYKIVKKQTFKVIAKVKRFTTDYNSNKEDIPNFWTEYYANGSINNLQKLLKDDNCIIGNGLLGICYSNTCPDNGNFFDYAIGIESDSNNIPEGYKSIEIPACTWAVFKCIGAMPKAIQDMWKRIYSEFLPQSDYEPAESADFEYYPQGDNSKTDYISEIWLPVKKKA